MCVFKGILALLHRSRILLNRLIHLRPTHSRSMAPYPKMLSEAAKNAGAWLIGGELSFQLCVAAIEMLNICLGTIPERDADDAEKVYNTATVFDPKGSDPTSLISFALT